MLDMTRGPSMKPAWAATKRSAASATSVSTRKPWPTCTPPTLHDAVNRSSSTALRVFPSAGTTWKSR